jgi:DNA-binding PadR family transcriptional regulator
MSETPDKRRRTDLDLFVLALIESGVATPYELQKAAGISQGASVPTLQRLLEAGSVRQGKTGPRGRSDCKVTAAGKKTLKSGWQPLIEEGPSGDLDADLRVALLALWGGDRRLATRFLHQSSNKILESLANIEQRDNSQAAAPIAHWYTALRLVAAKTRMESESAAVRAMIGLLPRTLSTPGRRRKPKTGQ